MRILDLFISVALLGSLAASADAPEYYLSKTKKNQVNSFLLRLADDEYQYVVTNSPVKDALSTVRVQLKAGEELYVLEGGAERFTLLGIRGRLEDAHVKGGILHHVPNELIHAQENKVDLKKSISKGLKFDLVGLSNPTADEASEFLAVIAGEKPANGNGDLIRERKTEAMKKLARTYLKSEFEKLGFEFKEQAFSKAGYDGVNFSAEKKGSEKGFVIVSAHYDSVNSPGADDDGTGVATLLMIAKALSNSELKQGIKLVGFDLEEVGLVGSKAYAKYLDGQNEMENLLGLIQIEMTGYNPEKHNAIHVIDCNENTSAQLSELVLGSIKENNFPLKKVDACTSRSDHAVFWQYNKPAIVVGENFFGGDGNPCYHKKCDTQKDLDHTYMAEIASAVLGAVSKIVLP
jgi:hypothetical protein